METMTIERTTVYLPDDLRRELKQTALDDDSTMTALIVQACRELLEKRKKGRK